MKKIIVSVTNDLSTDQRVEKVCNTLFNAGYEILLVGKKDTNSKPLLRNYRTKRIKVFFKKSILFYAEFNIKLFFILLFTKKDIFLSNDLDTLLPNYIASLLQDKKIIYDSHELFSEVPELVNRPFAKNFWLRLERQILPKLKNTYTVCDSIANFYNTKYDTNFKTIINSPNKKEVTTSSFPFTYKDEKIILYQGAINIGRGLELIINTMPFLKNCILVIIGEGDIFESLKKKVTVKELHHQIYFLGKLNPNELHQLTPLADLGISIEEDLGLNYRFALPNKILDYIQAEVPILVSNLPEMKKIVIDYKVGEIVYQREPKKLAHQIKQTLAKDFTKELKNAKEKLIWEHQETKLLAIFKNAK
ncbi:MULTISPECIES: glycosyltransferase [unclassified Polaribacter]|uniref:glycosyltransferase n=1 Tax=unclassified Polaribacter TaxID=196858 RepID=UPI00167415CD|nr:MULTISPECIES: glycosyltransferase [unclassified Polaribacter]